MTLIASYRRTPFGKLLGGLAGLSAPHLGAEAVTASLQAAGVDPGEVDFVVAGNVLQAGLGQNPARQTAVAAGIPLSTPAITVNSVCLSGVDAIAHAVRLISGGEAQIVVCVGQESMTRSPHLVLGSRAGTKYGAMEVIDSMEHDGLTDAFASCSMGLATDQGNAERAIDRAEQDQWAARSHQRAAAGKDFLAGEITPVTTRHARSEVQIEHDEGVRPDTTAETLGGLRPAFQPNGTITAGNASQISDGAAAVVVMSDDEYARRSTPGIARIISHATVAGPDTALHSQPSHAISRALGRASLELDALQRVEINEAFASVVVQSIRDLGIDPDLVNVHGGAIALGHPIGTSGTRIVGTLARQLQSLGSTTVGAGGICGGGGQGAAMVLQAL